MNRYKTKFACNPADKELWDNYVREHPQASSFHLFDWQNVIHKAYGHSNYYLMAYQRRENVEQGGVKHNIEGVLPLVHLNHIIFGNQLVSLPFLDSGGILANCREVEDRLLCEAIKLGQELGATRIELRHERSLGCLDAPNLPCFGHSKELLKTATKSHKVRMLLTLPEGSDKLMGIFNAKLRNQIRKPLKEGLTSIVGGIELIKDFYKVFLINMRDLGSPVHSMQFMWHVLSEFPNQSKIVVVYKGKKPVASSIVIGSNGILRNPWASFLRKYAALSPNMLLYLRMLEYACDHGYRVFDFGRSSPGEGTYKFKKQWGAVPVPLYWHYISLNGKPIKIDGSERGKFEKAIDYWKRVPVPVTRLIGPRIRKYISL